MYSSTSLSIILAMLPSPHCLSLPFLCSWYVCTYSEIAGGKYRFSFCLWRFCHLLRKIPLFSLFFLLLCLCAGERALQAHIVPVVYRTEASSISSQWEKTRTYSFFSIWYRPVFLFSFFCPLSTYTAQSYSFFVSIQFHIYTNKYTHPKKKCDSVRGQHQTVPLPLSTTLKTRTRPIENKTAFSFSLAFLSFFFKVRPQHPTSVHSLISSPPCSW